MTLVEHLGTPGRTPIRVRVHLLVECATCGRLLKHGGAPNRVEIDRWCVASSARPCRRDASDRRRGASKRPRRILPSVSVGLLDTSKVRSPLVFGREGDLHDARSRSGLAGTSPVEAKHPRAACIPAPKRLVGGSARACSTYAAAGQNRRSLHLVIDEVLRRLAAETHFKQCVLQAPIGK